MAKISMWKAGVKGKDYKLFDRVISEQFYRSGTAALLHLYLGVYDPDADANADGLEDGGVTGIEDVLLLENRDRKYSTNVYEMRTIYNVDNIDPDLRQFGLFMQSDTVFLEFHLNDMLALLGRKIMPGDVIELPHLRDDALLNDGKAINKFYVVEDANRASDGYSVTWFPHIWRCKVTPMTASQEYSDILNQQATNPFGLDQGTIGDLMSTLGLEYNINNAVVDQAKANFLNRNFETRQYWIMPGSEMGKEYPWVFASDGIPQNGAELLGSGDQFPIGAPDGTYYLRTDYCPATLFMKTGSVWTFQEVNLRDEWMAAHRFLVDFINNDATQTFEDGTTSPERIALSKAVKPRADF